jgi:hypothetical protein
VWGAGKTIEEVPRSATCTVRTSAVLLEMQREPERLLISGSATSLKFLTTLKDGLISALRSADLLVQFDLDVVRAGRAAAMCRLTRR